MSWNLTVATEENSPESWELTAETTTVNIILSVEEEAASTALVAAARAEEAKEETQALAGSALAIANASIQAKTESVAAKNLSENARDISIQKASEAGTSEANSLANKNASIQAKTDAETAANTATNQAGIATQKASEAGTSEANSLANKNASIQAKTDSEAASAIAVTQAGIAATKATEAGTSEANSLANKNASIQAKTDAESAATTATAQAVAATQKADQTALDATATAVDRAQTGQDRIATGQDKTASESAATLSTEQATLSSTARNEAEAAKIAAQNSEDNALTSATESATSASNALASENATELAASQIVEKVDFTGAVEGDLFRVNSSGVAVRITGEDLGAIKSLYRRAPLNSYFYTKNIFAWDNADKSLPNRTPLITLDSGQNWQPFLGTNVISYITQAFGGLTGYGETWSSVFPIVTNGKYGIEWGVNRSTLAVKTGLIIAAKNTSNFIIFERFMSDPYIGGLAQQADWRLISIVNGVGSSLGVISNSLIYGGGNYDGFEATQIEWVVKLAFNGRNSASRIYIFLKQNPSFRLEVNITSLNTVYPLSTDLSFCGLCGDTLTSSFSKRIIVSNL